MSERVFKNKELEDKLYKDVTFVNTLLKIVPLLFSIVFLHAGLSGNAQFSLTDKDPVSSHYIVTVIGLLSWVFAAGMATRDFIMFQRTSSSLKCMFKKFTEQLVTLVGALFLCSVINAASFIYYLILQ